MKQNYYTIDCSDKVIVVTVITMGSQKVMFPIPLLHAIYKFDT
jgi:hypothetical protein